MGCYGSSSCSAIVSAYVDRVVSPTAPIVFTLTNILDSSASLSACTPSLISSGVNCTLRSAVMYCFTSSLICDIHLPSLSTISLTHGQISNGLFGGGYISIYGHGSTIRSSSPSRFMDLSYVSLELWRCVLFQQCE